MGYAGQVWQIQEVDKEKAVFSVRQGLEGS
jgi:hypothetical protein